MGPHYTMPIGDAELKTLIAAKLSKTHGITVNPERPDLIETRTLGGVRYILIKADEGVELNGIDLAEEAE